MANIKHSDSLKSTHQGILEIWDIELPCYVLEDGRRVLSGRGMQHALDLGQSRGSKIEKLIDTKELHPLISSDLRDNVFSPVKFITERKFGAYGYEATVLVDICDLLLEARNRNLLPDSYDKIADRAELLTRSFAKIGIIALIDEATGYQEFRGRDVLRKILDKYLLQDHAKWAKRFPDEFYIEMFKLKKWDLDLKTMKKPGVVGKYTNDIIYDRLAPGILDELKKVNPTNSRGRRKSKHHQWLSEDIGHPALQKHIDIVIALMKAAPNWQSFNRMLQRVFPKIGSQLAFELDDESLENWL